MNATNLDDAVKTLEKLDNDPVLLIEENKNRPG